MNKKIKTILPFIGIAAGTLYLILLSWRRWPDCQIDFGAELYVPWQLVKGKVLFKDIFHYTGCAPQYFHALIFKYFGTSFTTLVVTNFIILLITALVIYLLFQYLYKPYGGFISLIMFLGIFAFGRYAVIGNYNYICPYSHELVYGLTLSLLAILLIKNWLDNPRIIYLALIGFLTGLILLTKIEIAAAFLPSFSMAFCLKNLKEKSSFLIILKRSSIYLLTCLIVPGAFFLFMLKYSSPHDAMGIILYPFEVVTKVSGIDSQFYKTISGFDNFPGNLTLTLEWGIFYLATAFILGLCALWAGFWGNQKKRVFLLGLLMIIGAFYISPFIVFNCFRGAPFILIVCLWVMFKQFIKNNSSDKNTTKNILSITLVSYSILLTLKIFLNVRAYHYGFVLAMPGAILLGVLLTNQIAYWGKGRFYHPKVFQKIAIFFIIGIVILYVRWSKSFYEHINNPVAAGDDLFYGEDKNVSYRPQLINQIIKWLHQNTSSKDTLVVIPEGVMINYLARRDNPIAVYEFAPHIISLLGEDKIIDMLKKTGPSYVILFDRDMSEHGASIFGRDYGIKIHQWIMAHYRNVLILGELPSRRNNNRFIPHAVLMRKNIS